MLTSQAVPGRRSLIVGEVGVGKTFLTRRLLEELLAVGRVRGEAVAVLDLAPLVPPELARAKGLTRVGGRLWEPGQAGDPAVQYLFRPLPPPGPRPRRGRGGGPSPGPTWRLEGNLAAWDPLKRPWLVANDLSMFLHAGEAAELIGLLSRAETVLANAYLGSKLGPGELSRHERTGMAALLAWFEQVERL